MISATPTLYIAFLFSGATLFAKEVQTIPENTNSFPSAQIQIKTVETHLHSYTNHAGQVLTGQILSIENDIASIKRKDGKTKKIPLKIFPVSEQNRILKATGISVIPSTITSLHADFESTAKNLQEQIQKQLITEEAAIIRLKAVQKIYEQILDRRHKEETISEEDAKLGKELMKNRIIQFSKVGNQDKNTPKENSK